MHQVDRPCRSVEVIGGRLQSSVVRRQHAALLFPFASLAVASSEVPAIRQTERRVSRYYEEPSPGVCRHNRTRHIMNNTVGAPGSSARLSEVTCVWPCPSAGTVSLPAVPPQRMFWITCSQWCCYVPLPLKAVCFLPFSASSWLAPCCNTKPLILPFSGSSNCARVPACKLSIGRLPNEVRGYGAVRSFNIIKFIPFSGGLPVYFPVLTSSQIPFPLWRPSYLPAALIFISAITPLYLQSVFLHSTFYFQCVMNITLSFLSTAEIEHHTI